MEKEEEVETEDFSSIFGDFKVQACNDKKEPLAKIMQLDGRVAQPCRRCGRYPRIHVVNFSNREAHPKNIYIDCKCGECDGEWYLTEDDAVQTWNETNIGSREKDPNVEDHVDFIEKVMENFKIPD